MKPPRSTRWSSSTTKFSAYIEERRAEPRDDVLTELATATYPDGSVPEVTDVVRTATFLFGAGQETTAKLLGAALRILCDRPDLQQTLRDDPSLVPVFIEETLRLESPVKTEFRLARAVDQSGGSRHSGGHGRDDLAAEPRTAIPNVSSARTSSGWTARTSASRSPSPAACTPVPVRHWPESRPGIAGANPGADGRHHRRRGLPRTRRTTAGTPTSRRSSCVA